MRCYCCIKQNSSQTHTLHQLGKTHLHLRAQTAYFSTHFSCTLVSYVISNNHTVYFAAQALHTTCFTGVHAFFLLHISSNFLTDAPSQLSNWKFQRKWHRGKGHRLPKRTDLSSQCFFSSLNILWIQLYTFFHLSLVSAVEPQHTLLIKLHVNEFSYTLLMIHIR